jgi:hypothetical protein
MDRIRVTHAKHDRVILLSDIVVCSFNRLLFKIVELLYVGFQVIRNHIGSIIKV